MHVEWADPRFSGGWRCLLGFALLPVAAAGIAALFVGEGEKRVECKLRADIRMLS